MSVSRPIRCFFSRATAALPKTSAPRRPFHSTPVQAARRTRYPSIKAEELEKLNRPYDAEDEEALKAKYTEKQLEAIRLAEQHIPTEELQARQIARHDGWGMPYEDDMSRVDPVLDNKIKKRLPYMNLHDEMLLEDLEDRWAEKIIELGHNAIGDDPSAGPVSKEKEDELALEAIKFFDDPETYFPNNSPEALEALRNFEQYSSYVPELPVIDAPEMKRMVDRGQEEEDPHDVRLRKYLGWDKSRVKNIKTKVLVHRRVVNQTRMGKIQSMYYLAIAGNQHGLLGIGEGKSAEPEDAIKQARVHAIRNLKPIPRYENRTIYGDIEAKVGATEVTLSARPPGFGIRTSPLIFEMARLAGIKDLSAKCPRSRNKMNVVKATWEALLGQRLPEDIARARGRKLVDVRRVYYGASVN